MAMAHPEIIKYYVDNIVEVDYNYTLRNFTQYNKKLLLQI